MLSISHSNLSQEISTILIIIIWNFTIFQCRCSLPQVKGNLISIIANLVFELSHDFPSDLRLGILGNIRKISNLGDYIAQCLISLQQLTLCKQQLKRTQNQIRNFSFSIQFYWVIPFPLKYVIRCCLSKQNFDPYSAKFSSNSDILTLSITPKDFHEPQEKYKLSHLPQTFKFNGFLQALLCLSDLCQKLFLKSF